MYIQNPKNKPRLSSRIGAGLCLAMVCILTAPLTIANAQQSSGADPNVTFTPIPNSNAIFYKIEKNDGVPKFYKIDKDGNKIPVDPATTEGLKDLDLDSEKQKIQTGIDDGIYPKVGLIMHDISRSGHNVSGHNNIQMFMLPTEEGADPLNIPLQLKPKEMMAFVQDLINKAGNNQNLSAYDRKNLENARKAIVKAQQNLENTGN